MWKYMYIVHVHVLMRDEKDMYMYMYMYSTLYMCFHYTNIAVMVLFTGTIPKLICMKQKSNSNNYDTLINAYCFK